MTNAYKKAFGGPINDPNVPIGHTTMATGVKQNYPIYQEQDGKYYQGNLNLTPNEFKTSSRQGKIPYTSEISKDVYDQNAGTMNMYPPYHTQEYMQNTTIPTFGNG